MMAMIPNPKGKVMNRHIAYLILSCGMALSGINGALQYPLEVVLKMLVVQPYDFERSWTEPSAFKIRSR